MSTSSHSRTELSAAGMPSAPVSPSIDPLRNRLRAQLFGGPITPTQIGRFMILRELGVGGMGQVYVAYDEQLDRRVAVKVLRQDLAQRSHHQQRLVREAQALARLSHPNVVAVYEAGETDDGQVFLAMELVTGTSLRQWQLGELRSWRELLEHYIDAGRGLVAAHAAGLVHRDFKPENVLVGDDGRIRVADFGLALRDDAPTIRSLDDEREPPRSEDDGPRSTLDERLTATGTRLGTLAYMAPEQRRGETVGPAGDQFAFCVSLYEAVFGEHPTVSKAGAAVPARSQRGTPRWGPRWLRSVLERGLAYAPEDRYPDMNALLAVLTRRLRRRSRWGAVMVTTGLVTAGLLAAPRHDDPCEAAGHELEGSWNEDRHHALEEAFEATGLPFAARAWRGAKAELDGYARAWTEARVETCEATHVRHVQSSAALDLRGACLDERRREFESLLGALGRVDARGVAQVAEAISELPALDPCDDLEGLRRGISPPPPDQLDEVRRQYDTLADARSAKHLGDYSRAERLLEPALERSQVMGYGPLRAEALQLQGVILRQRGELERAREVLLDAADEAEANRHDQLAAKTWTQLATLATGRLHKPALARRWLRRARAATRRIGEPVRERAALAMLDGDLAMLRSRYDDAERAFETARALYQEIYEPSHPNVATAKANLASCHYEAGALDAARVEYEQIIEELTAALGPEHPRVGEQRFNLALVQEVQGELDAAARNLDEVLGIYRRAYGADSRRTIGVLTQRAKVAEHLGRLDQALAFAEQAGALLDPTRGDHAAEDYEARISTLNLIGLLHYRRRSWEPALEAFSGALALASEQVEPAPLQVALAHSNVGDAMLALGRADEARECYIQALALMRPLLPEDHEVLALPLLGAGRAALAQGDVGRALESLESALAIRRAHPGNRPELATTQWALARALVRHSPASASRGRALARDARATYRALGDAESVSEIDEWLGRSTPTVP